MIPPKNARTRPITRLCLALETSRRTDEAHARDAKTFLGHFFPHSEQTSNDRLFVHMPNEVRADLLSNWGIRGKKSALRDDDDKIRSIVTDALNAGDIDASTIEDGVTPEILLDWVGLDDWWSFWRGKTVTPADIRKALNLARTLGLFDDRWFFEHLPRVGNRAGIEVVCSYLSKDELRAWVDAVHKSADASPAGLVEAVSWDKLLTSTDHDVLLFTLDAFARESGLAPEPEVAAKGSAPPPARVSEPPLPRLGSRPPPAPASRPPSAPGSRPPPASASRPPPAPASRPPPSASTPALAPDAAASAPALVLPDPIGSAPNIAVAAPVDPVEKSEPEPPAPTPSKAPAARKPAADPVPAPILSRPPGLASGKPPPPLPVGAIASKLAAAAARPMPEITQQLAQVAIHPASGPKAPNPAPAPPPSVPTARALFGGMPDLPPMRAPARTLSGIGEPTPLADAGIAEVRVEVENVPRRVENPAPGNDDPPWAPPRAEPGDMGWDIAYGVKRTMAATNVQPRYNFDDDEPTSEIDLPAGAKD